MVVAEIRFAGARHAMIHRTVEDQGMARMVHGEILVPPGERYELEPGGLHVMLMGVSLPCCRVVDISSRSFGRMAILQIMSL